MYVNSEKPYRPSSISDRIDRYSLLQLYWFASLTAFSLCSGGEAGSGQPRDSSIRYRFRAPRAQRASSGKTYGGLLSNTYKFAPRKVQQPRDFGSSGALFGIGTEKLSKKKTLAKMLRLGVFQLRLDCAIGLDHLL